AGLLHLGANVLGLWSIGRNVEFLVGSRRFLVVYAAAGVAGAAASSAMTGEHVVSLGASGAILGSATALLVLIFRARRLFPRGLATRTMLLLSLSLSVPLFVLPIWLPVDNWAHGAGSVAGLIGGSTISLSAQPSVWSRFVSISVLSLYLVVGFGAPVVHLARIAAAPPELDAVQTIDDLDLVVGTRGFWQVEVSGDDLEWSDGARPIAALRRRPRRGATSPFVESQDQLAALEAEQDAGHFGDLTVIFRADRAGAVGAAVLAVTYRIARGWSRRTIVHYFSYFDVGDERVMAEFFDVDSGRARELGRRFVESIRPKR
ncbi:MAG: rhomboid family intramembrane serine protease, partial [Planctomycetes bacterium]|nr:rhomboid family intramembrane serine protease [Planctomycetota bacterium]